METAAGAMNTGMRRAHSEEMLSELDLNMIGSSSNEKECDQQKQSRKPSSTNNKSSQHHNQNGELSSTELEEEEDMPNYRYSHQGQSLCVSDLPRMRRNSDQGGDISKSSNSALISNPRGESHGPYSLQYEPQQGHGYDRHPEMKINDEFRLMSLGANGNHSSYTASPLATSEQIFLRNGIVANNMPDDKSELYMNGTGYDTNNMGLIDVETTQLNPELYSLQSNDGGDVMMTSSASLQLHHLHQYNQNQCLEVSSRCVVHLSCILCSILYL